MAKKKKLNIDQELYTLPAVGWIIKRLYTYFKKHTAYTDVIHVALGLGIGLIIAGKAWFSLGISLLRIGVLGHVYAFIKKN